MFRAAVIIYGKRAKFWLYGIMADIPLWVKYNSGHVGNPVKINKKRKKISNMRNKNQNKVA